MNGKLYLIPSPLGENDPGEVLPRPIFEAVRHIKYYVVEERRTARRFLSSIGLKGQIEGLQFFELNEHSVEADAEEYVRVLEEGNDVGLISEAGLPAVADPGAVLVRLAHEHDVEVVPFVGPSSLMLALMSSGMNGQSFAFNGYLPVKAEGRRQALKGLEALSARTGQTQILIETPYRNDSLFADMLAMLSPQTRICVAADVTLPTQFIKTRRVAEWRKMGLVIGKRPCVFIISAK